MPEEIALSRLIFNIGEQELRLLKKESFYLLIALVSGIILFKLIFYNETFFNTIRFVASLFWLFVIPGYSMMLYWQKSLDFVERIVIGTALGIGLEGILSYYLGLFGLHIKFHAIIIPLLLTSIGIFVFLKFSKRNANSGQ